MRLLLQLFLDICLFRKAPQDVPYSQFLFGLLLAANIVLQFTLSLVFGNEEEALNEIEILLYVISTTLLILLIVSFILFVLGFSKRILQTLSAFLGTNLIWFPMIVLIDVIGHSIPVLEPILTTLSMIAIGWRLAFHANILRYALSSSIFSAGFLSVGLLFLEIIIGQMFLQAVE